MPLTNEHAKQQAAGVLSDWLDTCETRDRERAAELKRGLIRRRIPAPESDVETRKAGVAGVLEEWLNRPAETEGVK